MHAQPVGDVELLQGPVRKWALLPWLPIYIIQDVCLRVLVLAIVISILFGNIPVVRHVRFDFLVLQLQFASYCPG
jgi:hypothetical protein